MEVLDRAAGQQYVDELASIVLDNGPAVDAQWQTNELATQLALRGQLKDALQLVEATLLLFPDPTNYLAWLHCRRGELHQAIDRTDLALLDLDAAKAALPYSVHPLIEMRVEGLRSDIYLTLGLFEPALQSSRAARAAADAVLAAQLPPELAALRDECLWDLRVDPETIRHVVLMGMEDFEGAFHTLDALLSDPALFPPETERSELSEDARRQRAADELDIRIMRGVTAVKLLIKERALGRPERAIEAAARARADLEPIYDLDLEAARAAGLHTLYVDDALLHLAHLEYLEGHAEAATPILRRRAWAIQAGFVPRKSSEVLGVALEAKIHMLQAERILAPDNIAAVKSPARTRAACKVTLEKYVGLLADCMNLLEQGWQLHPRTLEGVGFLGNPGVRFILEAQFELEFALDAAAAPRRVFDFAVRTLSIGTLADRIGGQQIVQQSPARAKEYLDSLPRDSGVFIVLPLPSHSFVLTADAEGVQACRVPSQYVLEALAEDLNREATTPPPTAGSSQAGRSSRLAAAGAELSAALFPPEIAERMSKWRRIVFVGTELLGQPPLECLTLAGDSIGSTRVTSYAPGLAQAAILAQRWPAIRPTLDVRLLAGPRRDDELGLDLTPDVARTLRELVEPAGLRLGSDARLDEVGLGTRDHVQVLAFLAHGHYVLDSFRPATVALAPWPGRPDGLMTCADVEALGPSAPPLILFLTCGSATGPQIEGDSGVADLGGAALLGGASCALVTTSDIALTAATALLEVFLCELRTGRPPDEALLEARRSLAQREGFDDPFYLHSVRLFGVAHLPLVSAPPDGNPGRGR
jgi:tetratricopeptide (TPR) repeat protein